MIMQFFAEPFLLSKILYTLLFLITIITDAKTLLISRFVTIYSIPVIFLFSYFKLSPLSLTESCLASITSYAFFWIIAYVSKKIMHKEGMGQGDLDLLATVGAALGFFGCWITLLLGSFLGLCYGTFLLCIHHKHSNPELNSPLILPFGSFLGIGALIALYYQKILFSLFITFF